MYTGTLFRSALYTSFFSPSLSLSLSLSLLPPLSLSLTHECKAVDVHSFCTVTGLPAAKDRLAHLIAGTDPKLSCVTLSSFLSSSLMAYHIALHFSRPVIAIVFHSEKCVCVCLCVCARACSLFLSCKGELRTQK